MNRKEMLAAMNGSLDVLVALNVAITKWEGLEAYWDEFMVGIKRNGHYPKAENCAMCRVFKRKHCKGCPLVDCDTRMAPWKITVDSIRKKDKQGFRYGIRMMLEELHKARTLEMRRRR